MQFDILRAFPYPVLRPGVDDYLEGDIQVIAEFEPSVDGEEVTASIEFHVSVDEIVKEVKAGRAANTVVFACRDTYYRHVVTSKESSFEVKFPAGRLRGEVQVYPYVAVIAPIPDFKSNWINKEFGDGPFVYEVGTLLAIDQPQTVYIDRDVFKPLSSVFELVRDEGIVGHEWQVRPGDKRVQIVVSNELKEKIDAARNNEAHRAILMNSIYFSAVMQCISFIKHNGTENEGKRWADVINQRCHNEGINISEHDEYLVAERLMKSPFRLIDAYVLKTQGDGQ